MRLALLVVLGATHIAPFAWSFQTPSPNRAAASPAICKSHGHRRRVAGMQMEALGAGKTVNVAPGLVVEGTEIRVDEETTTLLIDGSVRINRLVCPPELCLIVGPGGRLTCLNAGSTESAMVRCQRAIIAGEVNANVVCDELVLEEGARVTGELWARSVTAASGNVVAGSIRMVPIGPCPYRSASVARPAAEAVGSGADCVCGSVQLSQERQPSSYGNLNASEAPPQLSAASPTKSLEVANIARGIIARDTQNLRPVLTADDDANAAEATLGIEPPAEQPVVGLEDAVAVAAAALEEARRAKARQAVADASRERLVAKAKADQEAAEKAKADADAAFEAKKAASAAIETARGKAKAEATAKSASEVEAKKEAEAEAAAVRIAQAAKVIRERRERAAAAAAVEGKAKVEAEVADAERTVQVAEEVRLAGANGAEERRLAEEKAVAQVEAGKQEAFVEAKQRTEREAAEAKAVDEAEAEAKQGRLWLEKEAQKIDEKLAEEQRQLEQRLPTEATVVEARVAEYTRATKAIEEVRAAEEARVGEDAEAADRRRALAASRAAAEKERARLEEQARMKAAAKATAQEQEEEAAERNRLLTVARARAAADQEQMRMESAARLKGEAYPTYPPAVTAAVSDLMHTRHGELAAEDAAAGAVRKEAEQIEAARAKEEKVDLRSGLLEAQSPDERATLLRTVSETASTSPASNLTDRSMAEAAEAYKSYAVANMAKEILNRNPSPPCAEQLEGAQLEEVAGGGQPMEENKKVADVCDPTEAYTNIYAEQNAAEGRASIRVEEGEYASLALANLAKDIISKNRLDKSRFPEPAIRSRAADVEKHMGPRELGGGDGKGDPDVDIYINGIKVKAPNKGNFLPSGVRARLDRR